MRRLLNAQTDRLIGTAQATLTQPLYTGGKTQANVNRAKNQVMAERANLIAQEQTSFTNTVNAYVGVIQAQQLLALEHQQRAGAGQAAPGDQRPVPGRRDHPHRRGTGRGGAGRRDGAAGRPRKAICRRRAARFSRWSATCRRRPGRAAAARAAGQDRAGSDGASAAANNPSVVAALFNDAAAKDAVDVAFAQLMPQVSLQGQVFQQNNAAPRSTANNGYQARRAALGAGLPGRRRIFRGAPGAAGRAADAQGWWTMPGAPRCRMR